MLRAAVVVQNCKCVMRLPLSEGSSNEFEGCQDRFPVRRPPGRLHFVVAFWPSADRVPTRALNEPGASGRTRPPRHID